MRPLILWLVLLMALPLLTLFVVTPMDVGPQAFLGIASVTLMVIANRLFPRSRTVSLWLVLVSIMVSTRYIYWRVTQTLMFDSGLEWGLGIGLFVAELYAWVIMVLGYLQTLWPLRRKVVPLPKDYSRWPTVDVYIPTYNESLSIVSDTVLAAQNLDYPADKLRVYLLDDGNRPEFAAFAARVRCGYIARENNEHAKAGNLNNAMKQTSGELICVFDCDHVPTTVFLQATVGGFLTEERLALVQTPHHFYSRDPFERNLLVHEDMPGEEELFYGPVQSGNDFWNATFFCGSCAVIRRTALEETDGFAVDTVTEDAHTALRIQRRRWRTAFLAIPLAAGLATERLALHIGQRARWARGMVQIMRLDNPLFGRGLTLAQRLCYLNAMLHFLFPLPRVVFLTAPLAYLLFSQNIIASSAPMLFAYAFPHVMHAVYTNSRRHGRYRYTFWAEIYETVLAFHLVRPTLATFWNPRRGKFNVTEKGGLLKESYFDWRTAMPLIVTSFLMTAALGWGIVRLIWQDYYGIEPGVMVLNIFWAGFSQIILWASIAVARERRQLRTTARINMVLPAQLYLTDGHVISTETRDLSVDGARLRLPDKQYMTAPLEDVELTMDGLCTVISAKEVAREGDDLRLRFVGTTIEQRRALVRMVMGRAGSWVSRRRHQGDRPFLSLWVILRVALSVFFWRWMHSSIKRRQARSRRRRDFLSRYGIWIVLLVLLLGLFVLGVRPVFAETVSAVNGTGELNYRFADLGFPDGLRLRGGDAEGGVFVPVPDNLMVTSAEMILHVDQGELEPGARLIVEVNGEPVHSLELTKDDKRAHDYRFAIKPAFMVSENHINFRLRASADNRCPNPLDRRIWARVTATSQIRISTRRLPFAADLSRLPAPLLDTGSAAPAVIHLVLPEKPGPSKVQAAAELASWFGVRGGYRDIRFQVSRGQLPTTDAVVLASNGDVISGLPLGPVNSPTLAMVDNPLNPLSKLLVIQASTPKGLVKAVHYLAHAKKRPNGDRVVAVNVATPSRQPYDAPKWVKTGQSLRFDQLTSPDRLRVTGLYPPLITINFRMDPDLFLWPGGTVPLHLRYRFPQGSWLDEERSHLDVMLNGHYLKSLPVNHREIFSRLWGALGGDRRQEYAVIRIPPELLYGSNRLTLYFNLHYRLEGECNPVLPSQVVSQVYPDSTLDLSRTRHLAALPDLSLFASAGFPFSVMADLSGTTLLIPQAPDDDTLAALLGLVADIGADTGYAAGRMRVAMGLEELHGSSDRNLLAVAPLNTPLVKELLADGPLRVDDGQLRVPEAGFGQLMRNLAYGHWWLDQVQADRALTSRNQVSALIATPSPLNSKRQMVLMTATSASLLPALTAHLGKDQVRAGIGGDLSLIEADRALSFRVAPATLEGRGSWLTRLLWMLGQRPLVMLLGLTLLVLMVVMALSPVLRRRAARRLRQGRGIDDD